MSPPSGAPRSKSVLWNFKFAGTALAGSLTFALASAFAPPPAQIAVLGSTISILAGLFVAFVEQEDVRERSRAEVLATLRVPLELARESDIFEHYLAFSNSLIALARRGDQPVLRRFALAKLDSINEELKTLAEGRIVFSGTETWRTAYEQLLQSPGLGTYRSVAWVKTRDYWQDAPGRQSMRLNIALARKGLRIERIVILRDDLWPEASKLPSAAIRHWIQQQHENAILVSLIREGEITGESHLAADFGLYGDKAVGTQEIDEEGRTVCFALEFDETSLRLAREWWDRLSLYALPYGDLVDRSASGD
jgi:hypothetical protein